MTYQIIGTLSGIINLWLAAKQNRWCWPVGLIYIFASFVVLFEAKLYAQIGLHVVYLVLTLFGWYQWSKGEEGKQTALVVTRAKKSELLLLVLGTTVLGLGLGEVMSRNTQNTTPHIDGVIAIASCAAMWLATRKKLENWWFWFFINSAAIVMYGQQKLYFYMTLYAVFLGLAIWGYKRWKN